MSPRALDCAVPPLGFPRVSGDEPLNEAVKAQDAKFSPRERG